MQALQFRAYDAGASGRVIALRSMLPLIARDASTVWIHCAVEGEWLGHSAGAFSFTRKTFDEILRNFNEQHNPIPLTFEHPSHSGNGQPIPAAGWIHQFEVRDDGLWAQAELTKKAADHIREGEYRFCSVVVRFDSMDRASGEEIGAEIDEIGLVNSPFIDGLKPITLSRLAGLKTTRRKLSMMTINEIVKKALKDLGDDMTLEQFVSYVEAQKKLNDVIDGNTGAAPADDVPAAEAAAASKEAATPAEPAEVVAASITESSAPAEVAAEATPAAVAGEFEAVLAAISERTGMDTASVLTEMRTRIEDIAALLDGAPVTPTPVPEAGLSADAAGVALSAAKARVEALEARDKAKDTKLSALEAKLAELQVGAIDRRIDDAVKAGHILETHRKLYHALARQNAAEFDEMLKGHAASPVVPTGTLVAGHSSPKPTKLAAEENEPEEVRYLRKNLRAAKLSKEAEDDAVSRFVAART